MRPRGRAVRGPAISACRAVAAVVRVTGVGMSGAAATHAWRGRRGRDRIGVVFRVENPCRCPSSPPRRPRSDRSPTWRTSSASTRRAGRRSAVDQTHFACPECGDLLDVVYDWDRLPVPRRLSDFEAKWSDRLDPLNFSGVWRFRELLPFAPPEMIVTIGEGQTLLQPPTRSASTSGMDARQPAAPVRGDEPLGQLQGQRHDRRVHPRPDGRAPGGSPAPARATPRRRWPSTARRPTSASRRSSSSARARSPTASWPRRSTTAP